MAFSGVMYRTPNMPFSASLLAELFVWVLPRYSDFTPFCFKLITCFMKMKATASLLVKKEKGRPQSEEHQGYCIEHSRLTWSCIRDRRGLTTTAVFFVTSGGI